MSAIMNMGLSAADDEVCSGDGDYQLRPDVILQAFGSLTHSRYTGSACVDVDPAQVRRLDG
jgi:hypothetical protein